MAPERLLDAIFIKNKNPARKRAGILEKTIKFGHEKSRGLVLGSVGGRWFDSHRTQPSNKIFKHYTRHIEMNLV